MVTVKRQPRSATRGNYQAAFFPSNRKQRQTITWAELPDWQKDNEYLISGYRRVQNHWKGCFTSVYAYLHNETVNIHSHLWGAVLFLYLLANFNSNQLPGITWFDSAVFNIFLFSAALCLCGSTIYHTFSCHSSEVASSCRVLDYGGIVLLTVGSFYPFLSYNFHCDWRLKRFYSISITLVGLGAAITVVAPKYATPEYRRIRTAMFLTLGLSGIIPVVHFFAMHGLRYSFTEMGVGWLLASGGVYILGALIYAIRAPECWAPGRFDYFFASHQIFHFCVVLAALMHYYGAFQALEHRLFTLRYC